MSSDKEVVICMWYTLLDLEERDKKKLWVHPLNQKRFTHDVIVSFISELRSDEKKI